MLAGSGPDEADESDEVFEKIVGLVSSLSDIDQLHAQITECLCLNAEGMTQDALNGATAREVLDLRQAVINKTDWREIWELEKNSIAALLPASEVEPQDQSNET